MFSFFKKKIFKTDTPEPKPDEVSQDQDAQRREAEARRDLGIELDGTVTWELSPAARVWISVAALLGSEALESGTVDGESDTLLGTFGVKALW